MSDQKQQVRHIIKPIVSHWINTNSLKRAKKRIVAFLFLNRETLYYNIYLMQVTRNTLSLKEVSLLLVQVFCMCFLKYGAVLLKMPSKEIPKIIN